MLINNEFVFLPIPKNASTSILYSIIKWNIPFDFGHDGYNKWMESGAKEFKTFLHQHFLISFYKKTFPEKKIIGIKRDASSRFISALKFMVAQCKIHNVNVKYDFENLSEDEIIEIFSNIFFELNEFTFYTANETHPHYNPVFRDITKKYISDDANFNLIWLLNFTSQYYWGLSECDIIFDIKNLNEFESLIKNIKPNFNLIKANSAEEVIFLNVNKSEKLLHFVNDFIDYKWIPKT
jgi:hypothetical protein